MEHRSMTNCEPPFIVAIDGPAGSGKSTVAHIFEVLRIPVYYADVAAKRLMAENEELKASIVEAFGKDAYFNGNLNREYIAGQVFNDDKKLELLNSLVHPATLKDAEAWMQNQKAPYVIKEAALIFESGSHEFLDKIIGVYAPPAVRIHRVMQRDKISRNEVISRMNKQIDETIKMRLCDYVINNDEQDLLIPQVLSLHEEFMSIS